jgi:hypothetical protein
VYQLLSRIERLDFYPSEVPGARRLSFKRRNNLSEAFNICIVETTLLVHGFYEMVL